MSALITDITLGLFFILLCIIADVPIKLILCFFNEIDIMVRIQLINDVHNKSVGENDCPSP